MTTAAGDYLRAVWVTRSFLDYRVPVFAELDRLCGGGLHVLYSGDYVPQRVTDKARDILGERALPLGGEWSLGRETASGMANRVLSVRLHPGLPGRIAKLRPDVLIGDGFFKWTAGALVHRLRNSTPLVICYERTAHTERRAQWYRIAYRRMAMRLVDAMCCNGSLSAQYASTLGIPQTRVNTGQMAADTSGISREVAAISEAEKQSLKTELGCRGRVLIYVGRMLKLKGVDHLVSAWSKLGRATDATLLCVGDGPELAKLRGMAANLKLDNVVFTGAVDYDQIARYYAIADAMAIATLEDNWSLVVPEAMAASLAVICSKYNGCWPELVSHGKNGWVFDPLDPQETQLILQKFVDIDDPDLKAMGQLSSRMVLDYTPAVAAESIFQACQTAITHARETRGSISQRTGAILPDDIDNCANL